MLCPVFISKSKSCTVHIRGYLIYYLTTSQAEIFKTFFQQSLSKDNYCGLIKSEAAFKAEIRGKAF